MKRSYIYLATPYSHPTKLMRRWRAEAASILAGELMKSGHYIFCPISMGHAITEANDPQWDHSDWVDFSIPFLYNATSLIVGKLPGWEESAGVKFEVDFMHKAGKLIHWLDPEPMLDPELWQRLQRQFKAGEPDGADS